MENDYLSFFICIVTLYFSWNILNCSSYFWSWLKSVNEFRNDVYKFPNVINAFQGEQDWTALISLIWFIWFGYFIPEKKDDEKKEL